MYTSPSPKSKHSPAETNSHQELPAPYTTHCQHFGPRSTCSVRSTHCSNRQSTCSCTGHPRPVGTTFSCCVLSMTSRGSHLDSKLLRIHAPPPLGSPAVALRRARPPPSDVGRAPHTALRAPPRANRLRGSEVLQLLGGLHRPCGVMPSFSGPPRRSSKRRSSAAWAENARRGTCGRVCLPRRSRESTPCTNCNGISSAFLSWCSALARCRGRP